MNKNSFLEAAQYFFFMTEAAEVSEKWTFVSIVHWPHWRSVLRNWATKLEVLDNWKWNELRVKNRYAGPQCSALAYVLDRELGCRICQYREKYFEHVQLQNDCIYCIIYTLWKCCLPRNVHDNICQYGLVPSKLVKKTSSFYNSWKILQFLKPLLTRNDIP